MGLLLDVVDRVFGPWCQALDADGNATCWVRVDPSQPGMICDDCWAHLAENASVADKSELAREPDLPPPVADRLAADPSPIVRASLAENERGLLAEHLDAMCRPTEDPRVLRKLARRGDLSPRHQGEVAASNDEVVLRILSSHPNLDPGVMAAIMQAQSRQRPVG